MRLESNSQITADSLVKLAGVPRLRRLTLCPGLSESLRVAAAFPSLEELDLRLTPGMYVGLSDKPLVYLQCLPRLRKLSVDFGVPDSFFVYIKPLKRLVHLDLVGGFTDAGVATLTGLRDLRVWQLETLNAGGLSSLERLPSLERLDIGTYRPAGATADLSVLRNLKWLSVYHVIGARAGAVPLPEGLLRLDLGRGHGREP